MKIALDFDDTITISPEFFTAFVKAMRKDGHEIHIVTDSVPYYENIVREQLKHFGIEYDAIKVTGEKLTYCRENDIDFAIDDLAHEYYQAIPDIARMQIAKLK